VAQGLGFLGEFDVEPRRVDFSPLEQRPGVVVRVGGVDGADQILGQTTLGLIAVEGLEGRVFKCGATLVWALPKSKQFRGRFGSGVGGRQLGR
jgi:hypothetical protein